MNILIIEPVVTGHHLQYLRWIVKALHSGGHQVQFATFRENLSNPAVQEILSLRPGIRSVIAQPSRPFGTSNGNPFQMAGHMIVFRHLLGQLYREARRQCAVDLVLLPYLDYCTYSLAVMGSPFDDTPWSGIVMRPAFHYAPMGIKAPRTRMNFVKDRLFRRLLYDRHLHVLYTIDKPLEEYIARTASHRASRLVYIPDATDTTRCVNRQEARTRLGIPQNASVLLVYGSLSPRKGIDVLLEAMMHPEYPSEGHLLLAGLQTSEVEELLRSPSALRIKARERMHELNKYHSTDESDVVFSASDAVWLGYRHHYQMSGVLAQAGITGLPVIACDEGLIGWSTARYQSGIVVSLSHVDAIVGAVRELFENPTRAEQLGTNGKLAYASHTCEKVAQTFLHAIER